VVRKLGIRERGSRAREHPEGVRFRGRTVGFAIIPAVPHIRLIGEDEADGLLAEEYEAAVERAGKVFNILKAMSLNPPVLRASMELYKAIMFGDSGLSRQERELLATVTSAQQNCHY
jgi:alkylhydroperoxidase family enzyme